MSDLPLFFRLDRDCLIYFLSEFLTIKDLGRMDSAFTMKKKGVRDQFLHCLSGMRSYNCHSVVVNIDLVKYQDGLGIVLVGDGDLLGTSNCLKLVHWRWLILRQICVENVFVWKYDKRRRFLPGDLVVQCILPDSVKKMSVCEFLQLTTNVSSLRLRHEGFQRIAKLCPALDKLEISDGIISEESLLDILRRSSQLKPLSIHQLSFYSIQDNNDVLYPTTNRYRLFSDE